ncbi:MAG TPA: DNA polymerase Y family protein [Burkholderiales bacterium]|nr:DNA polymerase Y family protein [Burkholderiales bacterium]
MLWVALHLPGLAAGKLEPIAAWACQFTPRVALEPPDALVAEIEGSLRYFGGHDGLTAALESGLAGMGVAAAVASGPTARAALWRARGGGLPLAELPVSVMRVDESFFRSIGIATVGELLALPRDGLAQRCGPGLIDELDRALGRAAEPREFFTPPERFDAALELPAEVTHAEALLFAARRLIIQLEGLLAARHAGVRAFTLNLQHRNRTKSAVRVELASPARDAERLSALLREKLGTLALAQPVEAIGLEAADFAPLGGRSGGLFSKMSGDSAGETEDWARLLERLQARLGRDAVHGITPFPDHRPEYAWRRVEAGDWDPHEFVQPGPRPAWLLEKVIHIEERNLTLLAGPERIACGWWDGDDARRDYFVARIGAAVAWVYREHDHWYLHGFFA